MKNSIISNPQASKRHTTKRATDAIEASKRRERIKRKGEITRK